MLKSVLSRMVASLKWLSIMKSVELLLCVGLFFDAAKYQLSHASVATDCLSSGNPFVRTSSSSARNNYRSS
jgi:hypothetical protein